MTRKYVRRKELVWPWPRNVERYNEMARKYRSGQTLKQVAAECGVTRERVRQIISRLGLTAAEGGASARAAQRQIQRAEMRDKVKAELFGCTDQQYRSVPRKAKYAYQAFRRNQRRRTRGFSLSLWDWWRVWCESGKWEQMSRHGYCMARIDRARPYEIGNVHIVEFAETIRAAFREAA